MHPDVYQRASALSLAIALVSVVLAAFFAAPAAASSLTPSPIIDTSPRAVLIRTGTPAERVAFANSAIIPLVDYGGFVLANLGGDTFVKFQNKNMILRVLSDRSTLYLGSVQFDTSKGEPSIASNLRISSYRAGTAGLYIVQFIGPIRSDWVIDLKAQVGAVFNYVPNFAFIVSMTPEQASRVSLLSSVQWVGIYQPAYRISHLVYEQFKSLDALNSRVPNVPIPNGKPLVSSRLELSAISPGPALVDPRFGQSLAPAPTKVYDLSVLVLRSAPSESARTLGSMAHRIYQTMDLGKLELIRISTDAANVPKIASMPGVYWVEPFYRPQLNDEIASQISAGNYNPLAPGYLAWLTSIGFSGAGVRVAVADTGVDTGVDDLSVTGDMHPELDNRVVANLWYGTLSSGEDGYGHGTHVAGIVAGDGSLGTMDGDGFLWGLGIAPGADIINQRIFDSGGGWAGADYNDLGTGAYNNGASISSNSWGISDFGSYLVDDMIYDGLVRDSDIGTAGDQPVTYEFSAGNAGWGGGTPNYGSTGSPGNAKNVITTGATLNYRPTVPASNEWPADNIDASIGFSSRGPTADGRIKPDIVAPGGWIASLLSSASFPGWCWKNIDAFHEYCGGTSMSGPMVSGGAALFVEYYRALMAADPSPAITKAALVNGAIDMPAVSSPSFGSFSTGPIPNMDEGWGRMHLGNVLAFTGAQLYDDQQHPLATGGSFSYTIAVGVTSEPFKASLAWTDLPGSPGAATELVNDLDLTVTAPDGTIYQGNNFVDGSSAPGGTPDVKNNLENVYISTTDAQVGVYTVTVTAINVPSGTQDYALVVSYGGGPTSTGQVFWGKNAFRSDALAGVTLMDIDLNVDPGTSDTATATATSDSGDSETVTVTEAGVSSGVFTGSIQFTSSASGPEDGLLTVANLGIVTITYVDASPSATKTDTAVIDDDAPVISGIAVSAITHNSARVEWATNEPSTTVFRYGTSTPPGSLAVGAFGTSHAVSLSGLSPNTTYFFEVEATDEAGNTVVDNNGGAFYSFITLPIPPVILIDNDFGNNFETYYMAAFTTAGQDFDYWNVDTQGLPTPGDLSGFAVVLWFTPSCGMNDPTAQATLASYLDAGGRLIAVGQDIGFCSQFYPGPLYGTYLHASYVVDDPGTRHIDGVPGDLIGDGLSIDIAGGDGANNNFYPDVVDPIAPAETGAVYDAGPSSRSALLHVDTGVYQVAYLAFNFEGISTAADRADVMDRLLSWILPPAFGVRISPASLSSDGVPGTTVTYALTVKNRGVATAFDTFDLNWSSAPLGWVTSLWYSPGNPVTDTNGDGVPDTGPLASQAAVTLYATVDIPAGAVDGDTDTAVVVANSVSLSSATSSISLTTLVPLPGVDLSAGSYFAVTAGQDVLSPMTIRNAGGQPDTLNLAVSSQSGWTVTLLAADGITALTDTDGDGQPDVDVVAGLQTAAFSVAISVPAGATPGTIDLTTVVGSPARNPIAIRASSIVLEYYGAGPSDWPTFHNTNSRRGASPNVFAPPMTQRWFSSGSLQHIFTGPIYADGKLFSTSIDQYIRARDPFTGTTLWSRYLGDYSGLGYYTGTPAYADGVVYTVFYAGPSGQCLAPTCGVYALDAETGATIWYTGPSSGINFNGRVSVAYADGMVFGGGWDGQVFALDAATGSVIWTYGTGLYPWAGITVAAGTVWVAATDPSLASGMLFSLDEMTGTLRWSAPLDVGGGTAPLFAHGNVYVGTWNGCFPFCSGTVFAFNAFTGEPVWSAGGFGGFWFDTPAYDGTNLYVGDVLGKLVALDPATGGTLWTAYTGGFQSSVAVASGFVYAASTDGNFYVFDAASGAYVESHFLSFAGSASHPAIGKGYVWVDDAAGSLYAFGAPGAGVMTAILAEPGTASVAVGNAILFRAQAYDLYGNPSPGGPYTWSSVGGLGSVLPLSANGDQVVYVAGVDAGTDTLHVGSALLGADATVTILPGTLDHVDVLPGVASIAAGTQWTFGAAAKDRFGNSISGAAFTWAVTGGIGTIDASGVLSASTTIGTGTVTAQFGTKTGTAIVEIVPAALASLEVSPTTISLEAGSTMLLSVAGFDQYHNQVTGLSVSLWSTTRGTVTPTGSNSPTAIFSAGSTAGTGTLSIAAGGVTLGPLTVTVTPGPVNRIDVAPTAATVAAGGTLSFSGTPRDVFGNAISGLTLSWAASSSAGSISASGLLTAANAVGSGTVTASAGSASVTVTVTIVPGAASRISVSPSSLPSFAVGRSTTLIATLYDGHDNVISAGALTWSATGGTLQPLSTDGRLVQFSVQPPTTPSTVTITVTDGTNSRTVSVTVVAGAAAAIAISAPQTSVEAGATLSFSATVTDAYGNAIAGAPLAWSASGGTITSSGVLTAPQAVGSVTVTATSGIARASEGVTVTPAAVDHLIVSTTSISVATGAGITVTVSAVDAYGNAVSVPSFDWSTSIGTINMAPDGRTASFFAGDAGGSGTITVSGGGKTQTIPVQVSESSLPLSRQATSTTSLLFLVVAVIAIAASVFMFVRYRASRHELEEMRKGGQGGPGGMG